MTESTIQRIKARIQEEPSLSNERKTELLRLLSMLESEITNLSTTHAEHAESVAGFVEQTMHEATRREKHPELLSISIAGLKESVRGFEASHPQLVAYINNIAAELANMGI